MDIVLPGVASITDATLEDMLVENLTAYFDWGMLGIGAFFAVKRPSSKSKLKIVDEPNFTYGRVWQTNRANWIWEPSAAAPPMVYKNNVVVNEANYYVNYPAGQVVFNSAQDPTFNLEVEYTYRRFNFYDSDSDWFQQVVFNPLSESVLRTTLASNSVLLPAVIIEVSDTLRLVPHQLGDYSFYNDQIVLFHIISDTDEDRNKIVYILKNMFSHTIWLYDVNKVAEADAFPLDEDGRPKTDPLTYPELVEGYRWKRCIFTDIRPQAITPQLPLFRAVVRTILRILIP